MENNNTTTSHPQTKPFTDIQISSLVLYTIILCVGTTGNIVVVCRVAIDRKLHSPTFIIISGLAAADFLFLAGRIPLEIMHLLNRNWVYGRTVCKLSFFLLQTASYSAAYHLVLLAVIRYYMLVHPLSASFYLTITKSKIATMTIWIVTTVLLLSVTITSDLAFKEIQETGYTYCTINPRDPNAITTFVICYMLFSYLLPLVLITLLHCLKARSVARALRGVADNRRRLSSMVVVVILMFGILLLPVHVKNMVAIFIYVPWNTSVQAADLFFRCLAYLNSCVNPFIYAFLSVEFRKSLKRMSRFSTRRSISFQSTSNRFSHATIITVSDATTVSCVVSTIDITSV